MINIASFVLTPIPSNSVFTQRAVVKLLQVRKFDGILC
jgi:hypothetical protein